MVVHDALHIALAEIVVPADVGHAIVRREQPDIVVLFLEMQLVVDALVLFEILLLVGLDKVRDVLLDLGHLICRHAPILERPHARLEVPDMPTPTLVGPLELLGPSTGAVRVLALLFPSARRRLQSLDLGFAALDLPVERIDEFLELCARLLFRLFGRVETRGEDEAFLGERLRLRFLFEGFEEFHFLKKGMGVSGDSKERELRAYREFITTPIAGDWRLAFPLIRESFDQSLNVGLPFEVARTPKSRPAVTPVVQSDVLIVPHGRTPYDALGTLMNVAPFVSSPCRR